MPASSVRGVDKLTIRIGVPMRPRDSRANTEFVYGDILHRWRKMGKMVE